MRFFSAEEMSCRKGHFCTRVRTRPASLPGWEGDGGGAAGVPCGHPRPKNAPRNNVSSSWALALATPAPLNDLFMAGKMEWGVPPAIACSRCPSGVVRGTGSRPNAQLQSDSPPPPAALRGFGGWEGGIWTRQGLHHGLRSHTSPSHGHPPPGASHLHAWAHCSH